jgi:hypothetical protein
MRTLTAEAFECAFSRRLFNRFRNSDIEDEVQYSFQDTSTRPLMQLESFRFVLGSQP